MIDIPIAGGFASDSGESHRFVPIGDLGGGAAAWRRELEVTFVAAYAGTFMVPYALAFSANGARAESFSYPVRIVTPPP